MTRPAALLPVVVAALILAGCTSDPGPTLAAEPGDASVGEELSSEGVTVDESTADSTVAERPPFTVVASAISPTVTAHVEPDDASPVVEEFAHPTAVGSPLVFRAVDGGVAGGDQDSRWIQVHLPVQPNGTTGWIRRADVTLSNNPFRIEIDRASYSLRVFNQNSMWLETEVAIGTGDTPTPVGDFYLLELLAPSDPGGPYGPYAFGLSGFSEVLESFGGADTAIIGLHGTNDPSSLGTDVSHGCIRIENSIIEQLAVSVPLGTPVLIT